MAPRRATLLSSPSRCLTAATVLLGVLLCAEYARPARAEEMRRPNGETAQQEEQRLQSMDFYYMLQQRRQASVTPEGDLSNARLHEARGDRLAELHDAIADLEANDAETRERAQERIVELGETFGDDVAVKIATTGNLEVKTRLLEVLETWRRQAYKKDPITSDSKLAYWRPYAEPSELVRAGGTPRLLHTSSSSSGGFMAIDGGFDW